MAPATTIAAVLAAVIAVSAMPAPALAQDKAPVRWRVGAGPQVVPAYPGADSVKLRPYFDVSRTRGDTPFSFEAPDQSSGLALIHTGDFAIGPALGFEGSRTASDVGADVPKTGFTVELGGFADYQLAPAIRLRAEVRRGIGGHDGWIGNFGMDYVARDGDKWLVSIGPRLTVTDSGYQDAYFGVSPQVSARTGIAPFDPDGGVQAVGATVGGLYQFSDRWGASAYAKYDRLVSDPGRSPLVRDYGSRNQFSAGIALTYSFTR